MAYGDIGPVIDTETWAAFDVYLPWLDRAAGAPGIYLGSFGGGTVSVRSVPIDEDGNIDPVLVGVNLEVGASGGIKSIVHVSGNVYATAFAGGVNAKVVTFTCDAAGNLGGVIDTEDLAATPANKTYHSFLLRASGNIFIAAYTDNADDGWIKTLRINDDGSIDPFLASWEHEAVMGRQPWLIHVGGSMYAIVTSSTASNYCRLRTFTVNGAGAITIYHEWNFADAANDWNVGNIVAISAAQNTFAIFYQGAVGTGKIKTCVLNPVTGTITPGDVWQYLGAGVSSGVFGIEVSSNEAGTGMIFCVGHGRNSVYQVWTLEILNTGIITKAVIDTLTLVAADWANNITLVRVSLLDQIIFAAGYKDLTGGNTGVIKTFEVEGNVTPIVQTNPATGVT